MRVIDSASEPKLAESGLIVQEGWNEELAKDLVRVSLQRHILQSTPEDAARRFMTTDTANRWYADKEHCTYPLSRNGALMGIIWFALSDRPEIGAKRTFAIRLYESAVGKGLALPFMRVAHDDYLAKTGGAAIWLETDVDNIPAVRLYDKFGYQKISENDGRVTMTYQ